MKKGLTFMPRGFSLSPSTHAWIRERHPSIDVGETFVLFCDKAAARAWTNRDWQAAFRNYVRKGPKYGGIAYLAGKGGDPRWLSALKEARAEGFREPHELESPGAYRTALEQWRLRSVNNVLPFGIIKRVPR